MKSLPYLFRCVVILLALGYSRPGHAEGNAFQPWWTTFKEAVAHDDKPALAAMMHFLVEWENLKIRSIASKEDLMKKYPVYFSPEIKKMIAGGLPSKEAEGFSVNWLGRGPRAANSYSLIFKAESGGRYSINGLYEGPRD